jgi:predicted secreted acid phosphatase
MYPPLKITMYFGDNITDFPNLDQSLRLYGAQAYNLFGTKYFAVPNPVYGSFTENERN